MASSKKNGSQVLIVGAGPSGLMMAFLLARFGIPLRIIDKAQTKSPFSRAIAVQIRTLEIFSSFGLLDKLLEKAQTVCGIEINAEGNATIGLQPEATTSDFLYPVVVDQPHTEAVLEEALRDLGVTIERGVELKDFSAWTGGFQAELEDADGQLSVVPFSYIIGADGAHSLVRKRMATSFAGTTYEDAFILADALCYHDLDHHHFHVFFKGRDFLALIPMHGPKHFRLISVRRNELHHEGPPPTIDEFKELAKKIVPFPIEIGESFWVSRFFVQCRSASHYQDGRIFLIGDAAHIHSPAGGQGMNTGLQDALNLAWKLSMVIKDLAPESLLLSYDQERRPVGEFLIEHTDRLFRYMVGGSFLIRLFRLFLLPRLMRSKDFRTGLFRMLSQTAIRYDHGAVCPVEHRIFVPNIKIGTRIPNASLMDNHLKTTDIHKIINEHFFTCFIFFPSNFSKSQGHKIRKMAEELTEAHSDTFACVYIFASDFDAEKIMDEMDYYLLTQNSFYKEITEPFFVIVRADAHVYCFGAPADLSHANASLTSLISLKVKP